MISILIMILQPHLAALRTIMASENDSWCQAAEGVAGASLPLLMALISKSLVHREENGVKRIKA